MNIQNQHTKIFKLKAVVAFVFFFCSQLFLAQNILTKFKKEYTLKNTPYFQLNAAYTDVVFKSWNKNHILVNAFISGKNQSGEVLKLQADQWNLEVTDNDTLINIISNAFSKPNQMVSTTYNISGNVPQEKLARLMRHMIAPLLQNVQNNPIPDALKNSLTQLKFDYAAYEKLGETYLKIWEHNLVKNMDATAAAEIRKWSNNATTNLQKVSNSNSNYPRRENNNPSSGNYTVQFSQTFTTKPEFTEAKKILEVYVPSNTKLLFKTRYGKVSVINELANAKAEMKYTPFKAEKISGEDTNLVISYAPVQIKQWDAGSLSLGYVKKSYIKEAKNSHLYNTSSRVNIETLSGKGTIESLVGIIHILQLKSDFSNFSLIAKNSDVAIKLPKTAYNFAYNGNRSYIEIPENTLTLNSLGDNYNKMLNGYSLSRNSDKNIQMSVVNSEVILR